MEQDAPVFFSTPYPELNAILEQVYRHRGADGRGSLRQLSEVVDKLVEKWAAASAPADSVTAPAATCPTCKAPCTTTVNMRGGEHGWGTTDLERTAYHYAPAQAAPSVLDAARLWDAFIEAWRNEIGVDKVVNIMGGADKLKAVFLAAARKQGGKP